MKKIIALSFALLLFGFHSTAWCGPSEVPIVKMDDENPQGMLVTLIKDGQNYAVFMKKDVPVGNLTAHKLEKVGTFLMVYNPETDSFILIPKE